MANTFACEDKTLIFTAAAQQTFSLKTKLVFSKLIAGKSSQHLKELLKYINSTTLYNFSISHSTLEIFSVN